jgi:hypothetical protein
MQQIFSHGLIGAHREGELALRPGETARSLDEPMPQGVELFKGPGGQPFSAVTGQANQASTQEKHGGGLYHKMAVSVIRRMICQMPN